jgi:membrane protease YdiL (CAAX protease family)
MLLGAMAMIRWPVGPLARIKDFSEAVLREFFTSSTVLDLALISVAAGLGEEMLFRGVLQPVFARWLGPALGLFLASVLFGLLHPITLTYVVLAALVGVYLGWLYELSGNLLVVIVTHALYDFVMLVYLTRYTLAQEEVPTALSETESANESDQREGV